MKTFEECVEAALSRLAQGLRDRFVADPLSTLRDGLSLKVEEARHLTRRREGGGACDGVSFLEDGVILYAPTQWSRRENFTLAHELGHWLVEQTPAVFDWLVKQPEPSLALETVCDAIAQKLLLTARAIDTVLQAEPVHAEHVMELYERSNASIPVCAIALASRMPGVGAVVVIERDRMSGEATVRYASVRPDPVRGWPKVYPCAGQEVPAGHPLQFINDGDSIRRRSFWTMRWGQRADFYLDAVGAHGRAIAVLADTDLWGAERFHADAPREFDQRRQQELRCCGQIRKVRGYPCPICAQIHCPECGKCRCDRQADELVLCAGGCFMKYRPNLLVGGLCESCH